MRRTRLALIAVLLAATALSPSGASSAEEAPTCDQRAPAFAAPKRLGNGFGYEPGIEVDSAGTIFVTAHKLSLAAEDVGPNARLASWLWRSTDGGNTFQDMSGMNGLTKSMWALEGDLAVDARDRLYFVDTWAADNHISRWSNHGATLDFSRPAVPSVEPLDDRPWVAAHGDGFAYYFSNVGVGVGPRHRLTVHRSTDGGQTFDPLGFSFPNSLWGFLDADPNSPYVYAFMDETNTDKVVTWVSPDRGVTWTRHEVASVSPSGAASDIEFPAVAVSPVDGAVYAVWDDNNGVFIGESRDRGTTWTVHDVTPFAGSYSFPWISVGPTGEVGVIFSADPASVSGSGFYVYGMIWRPSSDCLRDPLDPASMCTGPAIGYARLQPESTGSRTSQADFFQLELTADGAINVPWTDRNQSSIIEFTRQTSGPNMDGTPFCGVVGTP